LKYMFYSAEVFYTETFELWLSGYQNSEIKEERMRHIVAMAKNEGINASVDKIMDHFENAINELPAFAKGALAYLFFKSDIPPSMFI
jgi:hypothetical protein